MDELQLKVRELVERSADPVTPQEAVGLATSGRSGHGRRALLVAALVAFVMLVAGLVVIAQDDEGEGPVLGDSTTVPTDQVARPVPELTGLQAELATQLLDSNGFEIQIIPEPHPVAAVGEVVRQEPDPGTTVAIGSLVTIYTSTGPGDTITVPDVTGLTEVEAVNVLNGQGFEVAFFEEPSGTVPEGRVIRTQPTPGEDVAHGSTVTAIVSAGADVPIPNVVGLDVRDAVDELRGLGLDPTIEIVVLPPGDEPPRNCDDFARIAGGSVAISARGGC